MDQQSSGYTAEILADQAGNTFSHVPQTHYATAAGNVHVAYQIVGDGNVDLIFVPAFVSSVDIWWELPDAARFLRRLASFSRLIMLDKRGTGLSDRISGIHPMEHRMDDIRAVMDAAGSGHAVIFAASEGAPIAAMFAATYPERTDGLVLWGSMARWSPAPDYPWCATDEMYTQIIGLATEQWGTGFSSDLLMPSRSGEPDIRTWFGKYERSSSSPGAFAQLTLNNTQIDVRAILPLVQARTLVAHSATDIFVAIEGGRYVASQIPGAQFVELPGSDHAFFGAASQQLSDEIEEFVTGARRPADAVRVLATILLVDPIIREPASESIGASSDLYEQMVRDEMAGFGGRTIDVAGDRAIGAFDAPGRAIRCAESIRKRALDVGFDIRAAVHTGEYEHLRGTFGGRAVRVASVLKEQARPGEIIATGVVRDLIAGAGIAFVERGRHRLLGVGELELVVVARPGEDLAVRRSADHPRSRFEAAVDRALQADRPAPPLPPLTSRQAEVAYLVSCGLSNKAIATRLFLSERTVEDHVQNVFGVLNFGSRSQIAAWVAKRT
jgi:pimeloyl-ACP methyl ester carboxylesterase/class 3 adenylate cyclase/DNA-binding CsgD family transcriptional regulator